MKTIQYLKALYDWLDSPELANFVLSDLSPDIPYQFGAFVLADQRSQVVLIPRIPRPSPREAGGDTRLKEELFPSNKGMAEDSEPPPGAYGHLTASSAPAQC